MTARKEVKLESGPDAAYRAELSYLVSLVHSFVPLCGQKNTDMWERGKNEEVLACAYKMFGSPKGAYLFLYLNECGERGSDK